MINWGSYVMNTRLSGVASSPVDVVFTNAKVDALDSHKPWARAAAVRR
jgi:hypothetical protein